MFCLCQGSFAKCSSSLSRRSKTLSKQRTIWWIGANNLGTDLWQDCLPLLVLLFWKLRSNFVPSSLWSVLDLLSWGKFSLAQTDTEWSFLSQQSWHQWDLSELSDSQNQTLSQKSVACRLSEGTGIYSSTRVESHLEVIQSRILDRSLSLGRSTWIFALRWLLLD